MRTIGTVVGALAIALVATGCLDEQRYVTPEGGGAWALAIDEDTPAFFEAEDDSVYLIEQRIPIEFRQPTEEELAELGDLEGVEIPYAQRPWLERGDIELQLDWTLSNLSEDPVTVTLVVNGFNEFHEYNPGIEVVDDELVIDFAQWERTYRLEPMSRRHGTVREEELDEVAVDLASVVNMAPNPNQIVYFENQSSHDRRSQMYIPDVVPALTGVRVGLRSLSNSPVVLELTLRVRDNRDVLYDGDPQSEDADEQPWEAPVPVLFGPADAVGAMDEM
ncbi:MAG TPA: hypothetical protein RMH99_10210 [Sandaracinaceae bacterium LLY-WYZ-13_1]|nr:hypothetical protein [Sandaracinaceae bacterium LLY-WYZ-13_1]